MADSLTTWKYIAKVRALHELIDLHPLLTDTERNKYHQWLDDLSESDRAVYVSHVSSVDLLIKPIRAESDWINQD